MPIPRRVYIGVIAVVIIVLLGAGILKRIKGPESGGSGAGERMAGEPGTGAAAQSFTTDVEIPVEAAEVIRDTLVIAINAAGQAVAARQSVILAQVNGRVESVQVRENDRVASGKLLITLDPAEFELEVDRARASLQTAEANFREATLFDETIEDPVVQAERARVARAKSGLDAAEIELRRAELNLARTRITAPFRGRAASIKVVPGQWVRAGDELMTIVDLDPIKVEVHVLESEIGFLAAGRKARITFAAFPSRSFEGRIETINPIVDQASRTAKVTVVVPNPDGVILPGMFAQVALDARRFPDRILVPRSAILERDRRTMLFVYQDGLAKWRYVTTGLENEELVEIVEHPETEIVEPGELVLTGSHYTLIHDARVRLVENAARAGGRPD